MLQEPDRKEHETVNRASALWARPKSEISNDDYNELYKHVGHDFEPPLAWVHSRMEGRHEYTLLLYLPGRVPFDIWDRQQRHGVKLYVRRVFIMEDNEHLLPHYLRFVRGVIDSDDLPLNISREILQHNKDIDTLRAGATRKVLELLEDLAANDKEKFATFWKEFGQVLKEGVIEDFGNRERIAKLLRFSSTQTDSATQDVALEDYITRMPEGQEKIYYIVADSFTAAKNSPHLEVFRKKGIEVLLLHERVDEWLMAHLTELKGKPLQSVAKGALDLGKLEDKEERKKERETEAELKPLVEKIKQVLGEKVKDVRASSRLTTSPACLVADEHDLGMHLERLLKAAGQEVARSKPVMEINPTHPLILKLKDEAEGRRFNDWTAILFDQALLAEGGQLEDPAAFVHRLNDLLLLMSRA